jgi:hypothetical protein
MAENATKAQKYRVVPFSKNTFEKRWQITDDSGKVLDDAQGYGYKTVEGAHRAWYYKNNREIIESQNDIIYRWRKNHRKVEEDLEYAHFCAYKDGTKLRAEDVVGMLKAHGIDPDSLGFNPRLLLTNAGTKKSRK